MSSSEVVVVGIGGSMRPGSSTEMTVRAVLGAAAVRGAVVTMFAGRDLQLPPYEPGVVDPRGRRLLDAVASADAVVLGSPGYHGTISGLVKNSIDYLEDSALASDAIWTAYQSVALRLRTAGRLPLTR